MTSGEFIKNIIDTRGQWNIPSGEYWEGHHIIPECMGGEGNPRDKHPNTIRLYAKEHFIIHKLLAIENPNNKKLLLAYSMMAFPQSNTQNRYELTPDEYEEARVMFSEGQRGDLNPMSKKNGVRYWYNNGEIEVFRQFSPSEGFTKGRLPLSLKKKSNISSGLKKIGVNRQKVICVTTGEIFNSVGDAAKYVGCCGSFISNVCAGKRKLKSGLDFKYYGKTRKLKSEWISGDIVNDLPFENKE